MKKKHKKDGFRKKIHVIFKNGEEEVWKPKDYTGYFYDGKVFAVIKGMAWTDIIPIDDIARVRVR